ncbi:MAG: S-layer homology domain-containing protein [Oscillospiraceae bacterium]|nr:S-layer homology domain-containing protein [Oscillospiraceae bacterium]
MKKIFTKCVAVLVAVMTVSLFLPAASAAALSYSLAPATVNLGADQSGGFQITVQPDAPFGGVDFLVSLPAAVEIISVSYNVSGTIGSPGPKGDGIYFGVTNLTTNAYTGPLVCTVNIKYTGTGTAPSDIVISEVRLSTYTGKTGADSVETHIVPPSDGNKVAVVPNAAPSGGDPDGSNPGGSNPGGGSGSTGGAVTETPETETPLAQAFPFTDVSEDDWFYGDVYAVWENSLMNGTSATLFSPSRTLTRGMVVTVLYRTEGAPDISELDNPFPDVSAGQYYTEAVIWAADHEIVLGYTGGQFGPDDDITREQMAAILYRYERYAQKVPPDTLEGRVFADESSIGDYAKEAVAKLVTQGIIAGKPNNRFDPRGNATRAEFAAVLHRFMEAVKED